MPNTIVKPRKQMSVPISGQLRRRQQFSFFFVIEKNSFVQGQFDAIDKQARIV